MISETPRKKLYCRGRPAKQPSCNDFCRVCSVNFKTFVYLIRRVKSKSGFYEESFGRTKESRREEMSSCRLALRTSIYVRERLVRVKPSLFKMFHGNP